MNILALETSGHAGSLAAARGEQLLVETPLNPGQRSAQSIAPGVRQLLSTVGWRISDIDLVAVTVGPGSFTGLRVGVATAKTLAYAIGSRCVGINTLDAIAAQCRGEWSRLSVAIDAQRDQVFASFFEKVDDKWQMAGPPTMLDSDRWLHSLDAGMAVSGPALLKLAERLPDGVTAIDRECWMPRASSVALLAWRRHLIGAYDDLWKLAPFYLRKSAAEEKWESRSGRCASSDRS